MHRSAVPLLALVMVLPGVFQGQTGTSGVIKGTVAFEGRATIPLDSVIVIRLVDASGTSTPVKPLGESTFSPAGKQPPLTFELSYNPTEIDPSHIYELRATLVANGAALLSSRKPVRVLTHGAPSNVAITLGESTGAASGPVPLALQGTRWKLVLLADAPPKNVGMEPEIVLEKGNKFSGWTGCNNLFGTYTQSQDKLQFTPAGTTTFICTPAVTREERAFAGAVQATRSYRIQGNRLQLLLGDEVLLTFQAESRK